MTNGENNSGVKNSVEHLEHGYLGVSGVNFELRIAKIKMVNQIW